MLDSAALRLIKLLMIVKISCDIILTLIPRLIYSLQVLRPASPRTDLDSHGLFLCHEIWILIGSFLFLQLSLLELKKILSRLIRDILVKYGGASTI